MKLSGKTFLYSICISVVIVGMLLLYFVCMLPSLYVDYTEKENLKSVIEMEKGYMEARNYQELSVKNPTGSATLEIPFTGDSCYLAGKGFKFTIRIRDERLLSELDKLRRSLRDLDEEQEFPTEEFDLSTIREILAPERMISEAYPLEIQASVDAISNQFQEEQIRTHVTSAGILVFEMTAMDKNSQYTTYFAMGSTEDAAMISVLPVVTPQMREIRPIVLESLPMITAVAFLLILICSQLFSRSIVQPIIRLAGYAEEVQDMAAAEVAPFSVRQKDEIGDLGNALNELYQRLRESYWELEQKNRLLQKENERREVFLRASSHQLKTPVAAALLLVDGMMDGVGKYKESRLYLPQVKEKLLEMRNIIQDILFLNHCTEELQWEETDSGELVQEVIAGYDVQIEQKKLKVEIFFEAEGGRLSTEKNPAALPLRTDRELMKKIIDNLFSNACTYTPPERKIKITIGAEYISILNEGTVIDETVKPHMFEPFVSSASNQKGKGLGLYIAAYYAEQLGLEIVVENVETGVQAEIRRKLSREKEEMRCW